MSKSNVKIVKAKKMSEGQGAIVNRAFPTRTQSYIDPFVLMDEFFVEPPASFPEHPHRGFEALTYMIEGGFKHKDTSGGEAVVRKGGVQRVTMGKGVRHSELPSSKGMNHGIQLWVNLPQKYKNIDPSYKVIPEDQLPVEKMEGKIIKTIVGENSPINLKTEIIYRDITLNKRSFQWKIEEQKNGFLYFISGSANLLFNSEDKKIEEGMIIIKEDTLSYDLTIDPTDNVRFISLKGAPHKEPIKLHGSFVD
jgi:redox-sensitive bicupin YhaK (pirin superfamily)